jgi:hypothetical protein
MTARTRPGLAITLLLLGAAGTAQTPPSPPDAWLPGYAADAAGVTIDYESALPTIGSALLVRARPEEPRIAWTTAPVPADHRGDATFAWLFGIDADVEAHSFTLRCGDRELRFQNPRSSEPAPWHVAQDGLQLRFRPTRVDRHGDLFGFATLRVPAAMLTPGQPLQLEVRGDDRGSNVWYMTFRGAPREQATLQPLPALRRSEPPLQPFWLHVVHLGEPTTAVVACDFAPEQPMPLVFGSNRLELLVPPAPAAGAERSVQVRVGERVLEARCRQEPVREWTVHLVQHSHTDIGYTRPQTEILPEHLRYLDYALDYCDQTENLPDDAKFRWTCEAAWPVREFLRARPPEQIARLRRRIAEGRIEPTALGANLSELLDERSCAAALEPLRALRKAGLPVATAMQNDVNGIAWTFADLLGPLGVRYLSMGQHGHRALVPFAVPTAFWWESPAGARLLAWRADHYMTANRWSLHQGRMDRVEPAMFAYLDSLQANGYPFDRVAVQYSGTILDNSPPAVLPCEFIRDWNARYSSPRLRSSVASEFLQWVERTHGKSLPVHRQAWPDWWSDGIGSAPREAAAARSTMDQLRSIEATLAIAMLHGANLPAGTMDRLERIRTQLVMYGEHTYGAAESISDPDADNTRVQWAEKAAYVWEAKKDAAMLQELALGLLQTFVPRANVPVIAVCNPRGQPLHGLVRVYIDHAQQPPDRPFRVIGPHGVQVAIQRLEGNPDGTWWGLGVQFLPPFSVTCFSIQPAAEPSPSEPTVAGDPLSLQNPYYRLRLDAATGGIASLYDEGLGCELVDPAGPYHFGQLVHETLGDRAQLERRRLEHGERKPLVARRITPGASGPLFTSLVAEGDGAICPGGFRVEVRLFQMQKRIELHYRVRKRAGTAPEALYAAFPFARTKGRFTYDLGGTFVDPEHDLLPGTSSDWHAAQGAVALQDDTISVLFGSRENLLWQFGGLHVGRFQPTAVVERPHAFAWLANNYWVTNFLADQDGELRWSFALTSRSLHNEAASRTFALAEATPALCRVLPALGGQSQDLQPAVALGDAGILVTSLRPDHTGDAVVLQVVAPAQRPALAALAHPAGARLQRVTSLDDPLGEPVDALLLQAGERAFLRIRR